MRYDERYEDQFMKLEEAEQMTLGFLLLNPERLTRVKAFLKPQDFRYDKHRLIFEAMLEIEQQNIHLDLVTLFEVLDEGGQLDSVGRASYLTYLCEIAGES